MLVRGAGFRFVGALVFVVLNLIFSALNPSVTLWPQFPAILVYALIAGSVYALRRRRIISQVAPLAFVLDLVIPYLVLRMASTHHPEVAPYLAGMGLGVFAVIVALSGLSLQRGYIALAAVVATAEEYLLLHEAGAPAARIFLPVVVLAVATGTAFLVVDRTRRFLSEAAGREITRNQLANTRAQVDQLARLQEDKDSLVQLIVHDMKGPISAAMLSLEFLNRELGRQSPSQDVTEALEDALTSASNVASMICQILDTAKLESGRLALNLETIPVRDILESARRQSLWRAQSKSIRLEVETAEDLSLHADRRLFPRLLDNLIANAIRSSPAGERVLLLAAKQDEELVLSVRNSGIAIPPSDRERIFDKFQPGSDENRRMMSWGLGLYFCRLVTEAHHGRIAVEDVEGWTTAFVTRLPLVKA